MLLESGSPRPAALLLSFSFLIVLLALSAVLARPMRAVTASRGEFVSEVFPARGPLWLPARRTALNSRGSPNSHLAPGLPAEDFRPWPFSEPPAETSSRIDPPEATLPKLRLGLMPLAPSDVLSTIRELPPPPGSTQVTASDARKLAPDALGALPLPQLIAREATLAAGLAALPPARRLALPRLSIRVDADWLEVLPQTKEELYFSVTRPQDGSEVLAYLPSTRSFILKRPLRPLWEVREGEQVPALAELRAAAARQLGVSAELVGIYTWHPPVLENALRMFVLARMERLGVQLGPSDVVTVRFASGPDGCLMTLEPIQATAPQ